MKRVYFKIEAEIYFTLLNFLKYLFEIKKINPAEINKTVSIFLDKGKFILPNSFITYNKLENMINCVGSAIFTKELKYYFANTADAFAVIYVLYPYLVSGNENLKNMSDYLMTQLAIYEHMDMFSTFQVCISPETFKKSYIQNYKKIIHFMNKFYKQKKIIVKIKSLRRR